VSAGLRRAGFDVDGVDIVKQRRWPCGDMRVADALALSIDELRGYDFIWASPPCQGYTIMRFAKGAVGAALLIPTVRKLLQASGVPYCIENVEEAHWDMESPVCLCGSMFGLGAQGCQLRRHRLFECSFPVVQPACRHDERPVIGIYGGHARRRAASAGGRGTKDVWEGGHRAAASEAMGIDWMTLDEISEAIPPVYAEYIGLAARQHIMLEAR
jgi:DNA (cytosine-5)-methyltransferase 1